MAVRPIDAGSLRDNITDIYGGSDRLIYLADVLSLIDAQPTLTPPNEPLTIEQLQKMDGSRCISCFFRMPTEKTCNFGRWWPWMNGARSTS